MSMYIPEIKEEVSENAKMLVEDGGKVYRTGMPKNDFYYITYTNTDDGFVLTSYDDEICDLNTEELLCNVITRLETSDNSYLLRRIIHVSNDYGDDYIYDGDCGFGIDKADRTIFID